MLAEAQSRLETHFESLARARASLRYPVYALEHGFPAEKISELKTTLSHELSKNWQLNKDHWLLWVVIATELGYAYDGEEYWRTFAKEVPSWIQYGDRSTIRNWFNIFFKRYSGFQPDGAWANHFSIIAWPITHAILPRDLQGQFARRLYERRYELARVTGTIKEVSEIARFGDYSNSSRFQNFLEHPELSARLILALRDEDIEGQIPSIHPPTLSRIITDLESRQSARAWLKDARSIMREARVKGNAALLQRGATAASKAGGEKRTENLRLIARQTAEAKWTLGALIPDLAPILSAAAVNAKGLDQTRVRFADQTDTWLPGRAVLSWSGREQPIKRLSAVVGQSLIVLEKPLSGLTTLFDAQLRIAGEAPWLLRIQDDGLAKQIVGNHVRANQEYLVVSPVPLDATAVAQLNLETHDALTDEAHIYGLSVPPNLDKAFLNALASVRLGYTLRANIEPMGLVPRWDSKSGRSVWLVNEEPLLRLAADCPVDEFFVQIDAGEAVRLSTLGAPEVTISLGELGIGPHTVEVGGKASALVSTGRSQLLDPERLSFEVRAPAPWQETVRERAGFKAFLEPRGASLEHLLKGKAHIKIIGPAERPITIELRTHDRNGHIADHIALGRIPSVLDDVALRQMIARVGKEPIAEQIQAAPRVDLVFQADELGVDTLTFPRKVKPLYWKLEKTPEHYSARLIDETDSDTVEVDQYSITEPHKRVTLDRQQCLTGIQVPTPGLLLTAKYGGKHYPAIISAPPRQAIHDLSQLGISISFQGIDEAPRSIPKLIRLHLLWTHAATLGPVVVLRQSEVVEAIENQIIRISCGASWADRATHCTSDAEHDSVFKRLKQEIGGSPGFASRMHKNDWRGGPDDPHVLSEFIRIAKMYQITSDDHLCELALKLAFKPESVKFETPEIAETTLNNLCLNHSLTRGAFLARLVSRIHEAAAMRASAL